MEISIVTSHDTLRRLTDVGGRIFWRVGLNGVSSDSLRHTSNGVQTQPSGPRSTNVAGRLVEAETDGCPVAQAVTAITDEWFTYDKDGNQTDIWELTPNSTQYYHSTATFSGPDLLTVDLASPSKYTVTYGLDGEGRPNEIISGSQVVAAIPSNGRNAASQILQINLDNGTADNDVYSYDSSDRPTGYTFTVNGVSETGTLTWNANNTLELLGIVDGFNAGGTQYCAYNSSYVTGTGYDDLGRLVGNACGTSSAYTGTSIQSEAYSYDQYDNLKQSGNFTYNPTYTTANQDSAATYDASGNMTKDSLSNTYSWDQFNKMLSVNLSGTNCATSGDCIIYDAFGRVVETDSGSNTYETFYTQAGGKVHWTNGTTLNRAYWPAPGGGTLDEFGNGTHYYYAHSNWKGDAPIISDVTARTIYADIAYAPYGETYAAFGTNNYEGEFFAGLDQAVKAGIFDTPNREFSAAQQGRWFSPDPAGAGWNAYAYGTNPNSQTDPSGLAVLPNPTWFMGFGGYGGADPGFGAFGLLLGGIAPGYGTVGADGGGVCACPPTAPGSATGLGALSPSPLDLYLAAVAGALPPPGGLIESESSAGSELLGSFASKLAI